MYSFKTINKQAITIVLLGIIFFSSCSKPTSSVDNYGPIFSSVMRSNNGVFRGFNLGDKLEIIQSGELGKPVESDKDYLYYENKIDTTELPTSNIGSFNITYNFDEKGLNEIQSDIFMLSICENN